MPSWSALSVLVTLAAALAPASASTYDPRDLHAHDARSPSNSKTVIIEMFQWSYDSVAAECTNFIGPAGYGYVSVSPPTEHIQGNQWWTDYQPVSYNLVSKHGDRNAFQNMINTCHSAGVLVIADTVWNHMSGQNSGTGVAGSSFQKYVYPGTYTGWDFHSCRHGINNYNNATEVRFCELAGLADLATETDYVRSRLAQFGQDLINLGVDGLRLDAAKHMPVPDIQNILSRMNMNGKSIYITQEVVFGGAVNPNDYTPIGDVQEFRFTTALTSAIFEKSKLSDLQNLDGLGWVSSSKANVFVANHDTERNGGTLKPTSAKNAYTLASVFSLAHPFGTPTVLSGFSYKTTDDGAPNNGYGTCSGTGGTNGWLCQHRWTAIAGMVGFRNKVGGAGITNWTTGSSQRIAFGRGSAGHVAINNQDAAWAAKIKTSLPNGKYCDVVGGALSNGKCTGKTFTVSGGSFSINLRGRTAMAIHAGAKLS